MVEEQVLTPGGYRPKSQVHLIEAGNSLRMQAGRAQKIHPSGDMLADFGAIAPRAGGRPLMPENVFVPEWITPSLGSGWISYAYWSNNSGQPISSFRTTWVVPPEPATQSGQTVFLFNGIQNATMIYQPVLQWGPSAAGGGQKWSVACWYADSQTGHSYYSSLVDVAAGAALTGVMTMTATAGGLCDYTAEFVGIAN